MKNISKIIAALLLIAIVPACSKAEIPLDKKVARMIIVGLPDVEINDKSAIIEDITQRGVGGVILFERNVVTNAEKKLSAEELAKINFPARLSKLCADIKALSPHPIIISIDQEGGIVNRLKERYGFAPSVTQQSLGDADDQATTRQHATTTARQLRALGFNTNFAPCVDININPENPAIGRHKRSFSADPNIVTKHAQYVMEEHHHEGIITAIKHFPGHGSSQSDTHLGITDVTDVWQTQELIPYQKLLNKEMESKSMVMISHIYNQNLDPQYPSTLSKKIIDGILRKELGWDGVVVTDDMHMKAITDHYTDAESLTLTINAGADMIILSSNLPTKYGEHITTATINTIVAQVKAGAIPESRINEAYERISRLFQD